MPACSGSGKPAAGFLQNHFQILLRGAVGFRSDTIPCHMVHIVGQFVGIGLKGFKLFRIRRNRFTGYFAVEFPIINFLGVFNGNIFGKDISRFDLNKLAGVVWIGHNLTGLGFYFDRKIKITAYLWFGARICGLDDFHIFGIQSVTLSDFFLYHLINIIRDQMFHLLIIRMFYGIIRPVESPDGVLVFLAFHKSLLDFRGLAAFDRFGQSVRLLLASHSARFPGLHTGRVIELRGDARAVSAAMSAAFAALAASVAASPRSNHPDPVDSGFHSLSASFGPARCKIESASMAPYKARQTRSPTGTFGSSAFFQLSMPTTDSAKPTGSETMATATLSGNARGLDDPSPGVFNGIAYLDG